MKISYLILIISITIYDCFGFDTFKNEFGVGPTYYIRKKTIADRNKMRAIEFVVTVPEGMYFAIAFGLSHDNVNAIVFRGVTSGDEEGLFHDVTLKGYGTPTIITNNQYITLTESSVADVEIKHPTVSTYPIYNFNVARPYYSTNANEMAIECGKMYVLSWVGCATHSKLNIMHTH